MSEQFAGMVGAAMRAKGWTPYQLSAAIGLLPSGRAFHSKQVQRLLDGRRANLDRELVDRLIVVLGLDLADAYEAAGLWPPGLSADQYRVFAAVGGAAATATADQPGPFTSRRTGSAARHLRLVGAPDPRRRPLRRIPA